MLRTALSLSVLAAMVAAATAEPVRTRLSTENRRPYEQGIEIGTDFSYVEYDMEAEDWEVAPYARYGVSDRFTVYGEVPFVDRESGLGDNSGLGDIRIGASLLAYEDIFSYPWIIPFLESTLETGDEDEGLGQGETSVKGGIAIGTTVHDVFHFIAEGEYEIFDKRENVPSFSLGIIWDVGDRLSLLAEGEIRDLEEAPDDMDNPITWLGGMYYQINEDLSFGVYGGSENEGMRDVISGAKVAYTF